VGPPERVSPAVPYASAGHDDTGPLVELVKFVNRLKLLRHKRAIESVKNPDSIRHPDSPEGRRVIYKEKEKKRIDSEP
jgi:hypothetical protein